MNGRKIIFVSHKKFFRIGMVFGEKAVAEIVKSDLLEEIIIEIKTTKEDTEGMGLRIDVIDKRSLETVEKLILIKVMN